MTTPKAKLAGLALIAALCAGFILGLTVPASAGYDEGVAAYKRGDYATALREWRPLAKQGNANAQFFLGVMYYKGRGVPQDYAEAMRWFRETAERDLAASQVALGAMYGLGHGVLRDYVQAHVWINLAVSNLPPGEGRDKAVKSRDLLAKSMTPAQIAEAENLARERKPKK